MNHAPAGPREADAAKRMHFIELWCERMVPDLFDLTDRSIVVGIASQAGKDGRLDPTYVRTRVARWK